MDAQAGDPAGAALELARLVRLSLIDYEQQRQAAAKMLGMRVTKLHLMVDDLRRQIGGANGSGSTGDGKALQGRRLELKAPPPWPAPVDGTELLNDLAKFFGRHLSLPSGGVTLLVLWSVHTHCFEQFRHTPRLAVRSPDKQCGKTTVLDLLEMVSARPLSTASVTAAAIYRTVEAAKPTLLIDEADTFLGAADELRGILNAGHKKGGQAVRCVGDDAEPRMFAAFAPAAIAAIGTLPGTIQDRSVTLMMRRAIGNERPAGITADTEAAGRVLASRAARWVADNADALGTPPDMPAGATNRRADNWRPLVAIAAAAGGDWPRKASDLATAESGEDGGQGLLAMLLVDVKAIFAEAAFPEPEEARLATHFLVEQLLARDDRPWPEMPGSNKPLTATRLTRMLKPVGAERRQWRVDESNEKAPRVWGFYLADLADAFARYASDPPSESGDVVTGKAESEETPN